MSQGSAQRNPDNKPTRLDQSLLRGRLLASVLSTSWRSSPAPLEISTTELDHISPLLLGSGAAALAWVRVRHSVVRTSAAAKELQQAYRLHSLRSGVYKLEIQRAFNTLRSAGVEPILVKGWAIVPAYAEEGLRPYGDIDLCVRPEQHLLAERILKSMDGRRSEVDLHKGFKRLGSSDVEGMYARSRLQQLEETQVRVLGPEDHLRVIAFHMLREGAWRPLWLCDIAAAVETRRPDFDWQLCLGSDKRRARWVVCAIGLARELLQADVTDTPIAGRAAEMPSWLTPTVLRTWASLSRYERYKRPAATSVRHPVRLLRAIRYHWPNAIEGTIGVNAPFNEFPRLPFQIGDCISRTASFIFPSLKG